MTNNNPDNVEDVMQAVSQPENYRIWIDMESGVRTNDEFDLDKVSDVLKKVKSFNDKF